VTSSSSFLLIAAPPRSRVGADKPSITGWVSACLNRGGLTYEDVEDVKARLLTWTLQLNGFLLAALAFIAEKVEPSICATITGFL
jgi:hypothetical protein